MAELQEVFGIGRDVPKFTYVDRSGLDKKFEYLLKTQRHIVVHGASKQGKSCLRKKNLDESNCIIVQCLPSMNKTSDIWNTAFMILGTNFPKESSITKSNEKKFEADISGGAKIPFAVEVEGKINSDFSSGKSSTTENISPAGYSEDLKFLANNLIKENKRLVLEDFHYLNEEVRKGIAFSLKALYELGIYVIIIGIWSEQNLLTYYNGDLTGRIEEINLVWLPPELEELLERGEKALNIQFDEKLKKEMINSSFENVGLLQRIAEKICHNKGVYKTQSKKMLIEDEKILNSARLQLIKDIGQRYNKIFEVFNRGFRTETTLRVYFFIFKVLSKDLPINSLLFGIPNEKLLKIIQESSPKIRQSDLTAGLEKIERLQASRDITPLLVSYNRSLRELSLTDREFIFYRQFSGESFEFEEDEKEINFEA